MDTPSRKAVSNVQPHARDAEHTRRRILDAAAAVFAEMGLAGARVDEIAARAGHNKRMLYHYFGDKVGLYRAVMADRLETLKRRSLEGADSLEQIAGRLDENLARLLLWNLLCPAPPDPATAGEPGDFPPAGSAASESVAVQDRADPVGGTLAPLIMALLVVSRAQGAERDGQSELAERRADLADYLVLGPLHAFLQSLDAPPAESPGVPPGAPPGEHPSGPPSKPRIRLKPATLRRESPG